MAVLDRRRIGSAAENAAKARRVGKLSPNLYIRR
jgi:hypothetical protein